MSDSSDYTEKNCFTEEFGEENRIINTLTLLLEKSQSRHPMKFKVCLTGHIKQPGIIKAKNPRENNKVHLSPTCDQIKNL